MINNVLIFSNNEHPLYPILENQGLLTHNVFKKEVKYIFDFTLESFGKKHKRLEQLSKDFSLPIFCDLSIGNGEMLQKEFPLVRGGFCSEFHSPTNTFEACAADDNHFLVMESLFNHFDYKLLRVKSLEFVFPRVLSMIINEAHFALEEYLATEHNMDLALRYGVNYPLGPFEWLNKMNPKSVVYLLDTLFETTQDGRYIVANSLRDRIK